MERTEKLWRIYRGVYALEGPLSPQGWALAAAWACGGHASRLTAAAVLGYRDFWPSPPSVTIVGRSGAKGATGIDVHHTRRLDVGTCQGIPVTSPAQTTIDCARFLDAKQLKSLVRQAEYCGLDLTTLDRPGIPRQLRALLDRYVIGSGLTANELEARFCEICASAGLPRPELQASLTDERRIDFVWHDIRLIVETDGRRAHDSFIAFTDDRARDRAHFLAGYTTLRFTWFEIAYEPQLVSEQLAEAHDRLRI